MGKRIFDSMPLFLIFMSYRFCKLIIHILTIGSKFRGDELSDEEYIPQSEADNQSDSSDEFDNKTSELRSS